MMKDYELIITYKAYVQAYNNVEAIDRFFDGSHFNSRGELGKTDYHDIEVEETT